MKNTIPILLLLFFVLTACKKDGDETDRPLVQILSPPAFSTFNVGETISVKASIYHNRPVLSVQAALVNDDNVPVATPVGSTPGLENFDIDFALEIDNPNLSTGSYFIMVKASDESSTTRTFQPVEIKGVAVELLRIVVITRLNTLKSNVSIIDSDFNVSTLLGISREYAGSAISSEYQQLYYITTDPSRLLTYDLADTTLAWEHPALIPYPVFEDVYYSGNLVYLASQNGDIIGLNNQGVNKFGTVTHNDRVPMKIYKHNDHIITDQRTRSSLFRYFTLFYAATGEFANQHQSDLEVVGFFSRNDNEIIAFGNENGQAKVLAYGIEENNSTEPAAMPAGSLLDGTRISEDEVMLAMDIGVIKYDIQNYQYHLLYPHTDVRAMDYDSINNLLFIAEDNAVYIYQYPGSGLVKTVTMDYPVLNLHLLYNK